MARFNAETVKLLGRELYDYEFTDESATAVARIIGALTNYSRRLHGIGLAGMQPPFGYRDALRRSRSHPTQLLIGERGNSMPNHAEILDLDVAALAEKIRAKSCLRSKLPKRIWSGSTRSGAPARVHHGYRRRRARGRRAQGREAKSWRGNWRGPFHGVPIALKDLCNTRGVLTTGGSKILGDFVPTFDCTVWARLREAGAILLGKLNLHEFASGATNTNPHWGTCRNPYDLDRIPGGSSGGSGAAIVAKMAAATIGTDTGGSIRIPAAFCGCVGMKQTWGRVSRFGVMPLADSLDHAGPITRTVRDAALMLQVIAGHDPHDATSSHEPVPDYAEALNGDLKGVRVGVIKELLTGLSDEVARSFNEALRQLRILGAEVDEVDYPAYRDVLDYRDQYHVRRSGRIS